MTRARTSIIDLDATPYYHCICRCVRRAFLCGEDKFSGKTFEHRRQWIIDRLAFLSSVFAIDIASYAIMSNHYHLVLQVDVKTAQDWSEDAVISRWKKLCTIPELVVMYQKNPKTPGVDVAAKALIDKWRCRLTDISWLMRFLNEYLARKANEEDKCTGRFWEGRFKSQALLDEPAVLTAMSYVDLNPIRAKMAKTPETSDFTSIQQRLNTLKNNQKIDEPTEIIVPLIALSSCHKQAHKNSIAFSLTDYLALIESAGRIILKNKRGYIESDELDLLRRLNIDQSGFMQLMQQKDDLSKLSVLGSTVAITHYLELLNKNLLKG